MIVICECAGQGKDGCRFEHTGEDCHHAIPHDPIEDDYDPLCTEPNSCVEIKGLRVKCVEVK